MKYSNLQERLESSRHSLISFALLLQSLNSMPVESATQAKPPGPHVVTEEMRVKANALLVEYEAAAKLHDELSSQAEKLHRMAEEQGQVARAKKEEALRLLTGNLFLRRF